MNLRPHSTAFHLYSQGFCYDNVACDVFMEKCKSINKRKGLKMKLAVIYPNHVFKRKNFYKL